MVKGGTLLVLRVYQYSKSLTSKHLSCQLSQVYYIRLTLLAHKRIPLEKKKKFPLTKNSPRTELIRTFKLYLMLLLMLVLFYYNSKGIVAVAINWFPEMTKFRLPRGY